MPITSQDDRTFAVDLLRNDKTLTKDEQVRLMDQIDAFDKQPAQKVAPTVDDTSIHPVADTLGIGGVTRFGEGVVRGFENFGTGIDQLKNTLDPFKPAEQKQVRGEELQSQLSETDARIDELGGFGKTGAFIGEVAPSMVAPGGPTGSVAKRLVGGVAADTLASVADPVREGQTRTGNLATTAAFGGAARLTGSTIGAAFNKASNAKTGKVASSEIQKILDAADDQEISIFFDDVAGSTLAQKVSVAAEVFGRAGTGSGRARQNVEALNAAKRLLNKLSGDSDDFEEVISAGLKNKLKNFRKAASKKYDAALAKIGDSGGVSTEIFDETVDRLIKAETAKGPRARQSLVDILTRFRDSPRGGFDEMIEFRSDLGEDISAFLGTDANVGKKGQRALQQAREALDKDMERFAAEHGALKEWRSANDFYRNTVAQFKQGKLKALVNDKSAANFDQSAAWKYLISQSGNKTRARKMYQSLDVKGREAVRFGLVNDAFEKATNVNNTTVPFSPARFAGALERNMDVVDEFFRGSLRNEVKGLAKVMRHIERAGQFAENPPTGNRLIPLLFAGGAAVSPESAGVAVSASLGIKGMFQTKVGRNFLLAANKAAPGSKEMDQILEGLERLVARSSNQQ